MHIDLFPEKAQYLSGEEVTIIAELNENPPENSTAVLKIYRLNNLILTKKIPAIKNMTFIFEGYNENFAGYGAELSILQNNIEYGKSATAFDVVLNHSDAVRYGFLSDFGKKDKECDDVKALRKYHINMVQYYDWSYRHDNLVSSEDNYTDMMGRSVDLDTIKEKIKSCRKFGMKSIGYAPVYAASRDFYKKHPDWGLYTSSDKPLVFIDTFYIMNVSKNSPWRKHIIEEYSKAVEKVGFDGIHMDTYGFPKTAVSKLNNSKELMKLDNEYPGFIEDTKEELNKIKLDNYLIFNNVGNWPVASVANTPQTAVYIEVWEPYIHYSQIKQIIIDAKRACNNSKPVILAAYLAPFREDTPQKALNSALLLTAAISANGADHLLIGEKNAALTQGYYVDYSLLTQNQAFQLRNYYDFLVRYMELLYNKTFKDVSFTHIGWDNTEYRCLNSNWSADGTPDTLWLTIRENDNCKCINIINLIGCKDDEWNKGKDTPVTQKDVKFQVQADKKISGIYFASPDNENYSSEPLKYTLKNTDRGVIAEFTVPSIIYWSLVYIKMDEELISD